MMYEYLVWMSGYALSWRRDREFDGVVLLSGWVALVVVAEDEDEVIVGGSVTTYLSSVGGPPGSTTKLRIVFWAAR
jgi:hypothetical protein